VPLQTDATFDLGLRAIVHAQPGAPKAFGDLRGYPAWIRTMNNALFISTPPHDNLWSTPFFNGPTRGFDSRPRLVS
jgi:hypothetical protein